MKDHEEILELFIKSEDHNAINEFLIEASKTSHLNYLIDIDYLISNSNDSLQHHYVINLIFLLGEIGKNHFLNEKYRGFLIETYFKSDRWIRNEILVAFLKSIRIDDLLQENLDVIEFALVDDYEPIKLNALSILSQTNRIPERTFPKIIKNIESKNNNIVRETINVLKKHLNSSDILNRILLNKIGINLYSKQIIRSILLTFFNDAQSLEDLRIKIINSDLDLGKKEIFASEIKTFQKLLRQSVK